MYQYSELVSGLKSVAGVADFEPGGLTGNIDELCYYYAQFTGEPCPAPELFGAGDRSVVWTAEEFARVAAGGFDGAGSTPVSTEVDPGPLQIPIYLPENPFQGVPGLTGTVCPQVLKNCPDGSTVGYDLEKPGCVYLPCPATPGAAQPGGAAPGGQSPLIWVALAAVAAWILIPGGE